MIFGLVLTRMKKIGKRSIENCKCFTSIISISMAHFTITTLGLVLTRIKKIGKKSNEKCKFFNRKSIGLKIGKSGAGTSEKPLCFTPFRSKEILVRIQLTSYNHINSVICAHDFWSCINKNKKNRKKIYRKL